MVLILCRYVTAGTAWLNGAFSKVAKAGNVAGTKTREKFNIAVSNLTAKVGHMLLPCHTKDNKKFIRTSIYIVTLNLQLKFESD